MFYTCLLLISLLCIAGIQCYVIHENKIEKIVILSVIYYFMCYVIMSGLLFWSGFFSILRAAVLTFIIILMLTGCVFFKKKDEILTTSIHLETQVSCLSFFIISFLMLFHWGNFEFFGMGQDQGVYQTEAINLYYNVPMKGVIVDEYDELWDQQYKDYYENYIHKMGGYDLLSYSVDLPGINEKDIQSNVEGHWHGIPTYASILGLSAKMFGIKNMQIAGNIFFVCLLYMIEFILSRFQVNPMIRALCIFLAGMSPEVVWVKKSTLTEGFIAVLIVSYLYFATSDTNIEKKMSIFPVITFSYFHVTIFTVMPVFIIYDWILYFRSKDRDCLRRAQVTVLGYLSGFFMMWTASPRYTVLNYKNGLLFCPTRYIPAFVIVVCILTCIITELFLKLEDKIRVSDRLMRIIFKYTCLLGIGCICIQAFLRQNQDYRMLTIVCYGVLSGILVLPVLFTKICSNNYEWNDNLTILLLMFIWCIVIYSTIMRLDIPYYYYYGRYLMPYISIILVLFAVLLKNHAFQAGCLALGIVILFPYANILRVNQDDSRMEWDVLEEVIECVRESDCVLIDADISRMLYFPLKAAAGVRVYPVMETIDDTLEYIPIKNRQSCIYISKNKIESSNSWTRLAYRNQSKFQEEDSHYRSAVTGLPTKIDYKGEYGVSVYRLENETMCIDSSDNEAFVSGWTGQNSSGFRWTFGTESVLKCFLHKDDYQMQIRNGDIIPFNQIAKDRIRSKVYVNKEFVGVIDFTEENSGKVHNIEIPKEKMNDGYNEIIFQCDNWSPAEYGSNDNSNYGFSICDIQFTKTGVTTIDASMETYFTDGWSELNDAGFRWMCNKSATLRCDLKQCDYLMEIQCGDMIPFGQISQTEIVVQVFINGVSVGELAYSQENMFEPKQVSLKKELLKDGYNEVSFQFNTWSPGEYGSQNKSEYGISIKKFSFIEE
ncbi:MAG: hypothetical protein K2N87_01090 [Eubacterium sp.]|nr:hypothetical protein [Eubacterium sp.]